ncbi:hypothetical protein COV93_07815 [Candidatus Woesearchaeota archaeon CG11_big_fil_rev_8_21_14_0_20_43_8]|nr:MAG: hypothetical protein COV93_07815 [Candidatus Woesearchaeota archaeon CG11_big_fil_rev_8_21_14_0_20_43_8]PIO04714.1 MAG: hypothetical protein COT47_07865 [Candidatus Woesearchaeota archaeon CG08_land_8_20_14_0_20_43_7]
MKKLADLKREDVGKRFEILCKVDSIFQSTGPTIFTLNDGTAGIKSVKFSKERGKRAYPEILEGDLISAEIRVTVRDGDLECILDSYSKLDDKNKSAASKLIEKNQDQQSQPQGDSFLVKSEIYEGLRSRFVSVAKTINKAIIDGRPILIRHHADCDGYCAALSIERAILPLIANRRGSDKAAWQYFKRSPSRTPFYDYSDATKDVAFFLTDSGRFSRPAPLIILMDLGSSEENLLSIKKAKLFGAKVVVVDHHNPGPIVDGGAKVDYFLDAHINPQLIGYGSTPCAGMLGLELGKMLNPEVDFIDHLGALAGIADHADKSLKDEYIAIAVKDGYDLDFLVKLVRCFDYDAYYVSFFEAREFIDMILCTDKKRQKEFVNVMLERVEETWDMNIPVAEKYLSIDESDNSVIGTINVSDTTMRGDYFSSSKMARLSFDLLEKRFKGKEIVVLGVADTMMTFRGSVDFKIGSKGFDVNDIIRSVKKDLPHAMCGGGGHALAGTMSFIAAARDEVIGYVKNYIKGD